MVIAILLLLVPVAAGVVWAGFAEFRERSNDLQGRARVVAATTAAYINSDIQNLDRMAEAISSEPAVRALDPEPALEVIREVVAGQPTLLDVVLVNRSGDISARAASAELPADWNALIERVLAEGARVVSAPHPFGVGDCLAIGYPIRDAAGRPVAVLSLFLSLQTTAKALNALSLPAGSLVSIADANGRVLFWSGQPAESVRDAAFANASHGAEASGVFVGADGVSRMFSSALVEAGPWRVNVGLPLSIARDEAVSLWAKSFAAVVFGVACWLGIVVTLSGRLGRAVRQLDSAAKRIAAGDFGPVQRKPMPARELANLQDAFDRMLGRFNEAHHALDTQMAEERRIRQELQSLQRQVIRQERLAAVGQLVSGVAHEINNPLQAILGFAELLQMQEDVPESVKNDLRLIQKESARACGIIRNLALFARQQPGEAAPIRLCDVIETIVELRQRRLQSEDIELCVDDRANQLVSAVLTELQQVVLNFVVNAEQSILMSGRSPGRITIRTYDKGPSIVLEVEDTGPGIPVEHESKLFQPFFTTKPVGQGTGLGLSVSYGIIDSLDGHIGYRTGAAGGAIFYFELPAVTATVA